MARHIGLFPLCLLQRPRLAPTAIQPPRLLLSVTSSSPQVCLKSMRPYCLPSPCVMHCELHLSARLWSTPRFSQVGPARNAPCLRLRSFEDDFHGPHRNSSRKMHSKPPAIKIHSLTAILTSFCNRVGWNYLSKQVESRKDCRGAHYTGGLLCNGHRDASTSCNDI